MAINNLFSKRMKAERGEFPDVYQYNNFDYNLRVKVIYIINECLGRYDYETERLCQKIITILCKEYGVFRLTDGHSESDYEYLFKYFLNEKEVEMALNVVELCFQHIDKVAREDYGFEYHENTKISPDDAIKELNDRFKEEGFGYKYESGMIIKLTNELTHNEIIKPVLKLLSDKDFKGAEEEFLSAHTHYRKSENKECITDCLKAFESTMKIICKKRKIEIKDNCTAKQLIARLFESNYFPPYLHSYFTSFQSMLESGVPTLRNNLSAHGQGDKTIQPDDNITEYAIHLTASNILFLMKLL